MTLFFSYFISSLISVIYRFERIKKLYYKQVLECLYKHFKIQSM